MFLLEALLAAGSGASNLSIENCFAATLYTGTSANRTIASGINLTGTGANPLGTGGLVWIKERSFVTENRLFDTVRGATAALDTADTAGSVTYSTTLTAFSSTGFSLGSSNTTNQSGATYVAWTFRRAARFFDIATWTGNGATNRTVSHGLGVEPGMIVVKRTDAGGATNWFVHHRSSPANLRLNLTDAGGTNGIGTPGTHTASGFLIAPTSVDMSSVNASGATYVAYLWAHDASADGLVQCGTYAGNNSTTGPTVVLGWEPQFLMIKRANGFGNWNMMDAARGLSSGGTEPNLKANSDDAETAVEFVAPSSTGFQVKSTSFEVNSTGGDYIYLAIRKAI